MRIGDRIEAAYFIASSTATKSTFPFASSTVLTVTSNLYNTALSNGCLTAVSGLITSTGVACGTGGGGSGGGTWSTTTSTVAGRLINYPNNTTDIINVGSNSTTTGKFYYDPNTTKGFMNGSFVVGTAQPTYADDNLSVADFVTDINGYTFVGIQNKNAGSTASSDLVFANHKTTITDYYADCGISGGNNSDPIFTGIGGASAYYCFNTDGPVSFGIGTTTAGSDFNWTVSSDGGNSYLTSDIKMKLTNGGNLGIGTTSPYAKLSVVGNSGVVAEKFVATSTTAISSFGGSVGIGTTSPSKKLEIASGDLSITSGNGQGRGITFSTDTMDDTSRPSRKFLRNNFAAFLGDDHAAQSFSFMTSLASTRAFSATVRAYGAETGGFTNYSGLTHDGTDGSILTNVGDLVLSPATLKVGIGTSSPATELNIAATLPEITLSDTDASTNQKHWFLEADTGIFSIGTTSDQLVKTANRPFAIGVTGNVGIGTSSPSARLDIYNTSNSNAGLYVEGGTTGVTIAQFARRSGSVADLIINASAGEPQMIFSANNTNGYTAGYDVSNSAFSISRGGVVGTQDSFVVKGTNIGIATSSPYAPLSVVGFGGIVTPNITATSTTATSTFAGGVDLRNATVQQKAGLKFGIATSTAWTGTTTRQLGAITTLQTWNSATCYTTVGTLNIVFGDGTKSTNMIQASSTPATFALTTNNRFVAGSKSQVSIGTPASSPVEISCTIDYTTNI